MTEAVDTADTADTAEEQGGLFFLVDSAWRPTEEASQPPVTAMIGAWRVLPDGTRGRFQPNPLYLPSTPGSPLDPVDAVLGLLARGEFDADQLPEVLSDVVFGIALDEQGVAIVRHAPDGVPSVLVTTSYGHRDRVGAASWRSVTLAELAAALPERGVDVLLNPGATTSLRVLADAVRAHGQEHHLRVDEPPRTAQPPTRGGLRDASRSDLTGSRSPGRT